MANFNLDKQRGKVGENLVKQYFISQGYEIKDTSEEQLFQNDDIDFIVADSLTYEVKTDYMFSRTGNFALEDSYQNAHGIIKSWLWTSKADRFAFVNPKNLSKFVVIDADILRALVTLENLRVAYHDDYYKIIKLYLLPYSEYKELFEICELEGVS